MLGKLSSQITYKLSEWKIEISWNIKIDNKFQVPYRNITKVICLQLILYKYT